MVEEESENISTDLGGTVRKSEEEMRTLELETSKTKTKRTIDTVETRENHKFSTDKGGTVRDAREYK